MVADDWAIPRLMLLFCAAKELCGWETVTPQPVLSPLQVSLIAVFGLILFKVSILCLPVYGTAPNRPSSMGFTLVIDQMPRTRSIQIVRIHPASGPLHTLGICML